MYFELFAIILIQTSDSSLKISWAAYRPGNSNRLEKAVIHKTNTLKISSAPKDSLLVK